LGGAWGEHGDHQIGGVALERGLDPGEELGADVDLRRHLLGDQPADRAQQRIDGDDAIEHHHHGGLPPGAQLGDRGRQRGLGGEQRAAAASSTRRPCAVSLVR
jgi:hypothetical protein